MKKKKIRKIKKDGREYNRRVVEVAIGFCPQILTCKTCGSPTLKGYCCTYCGEIDPTGAG